MEKGKFDITEMFGMADEFQPNYQHENPLEFAALTSYYMERYYDYAKEPERYWHKLTSAIKWANKSIMLNKLGVMDVEDTAPDLFKSTFNALAAQEPDLLIKGDSVYVTDSLQKSILAGDEDRNSRYEKLWKATYDTITIK